MRNFGKTDLARGLSLLAIESCVLPQHTCRKHRGLAGLVFLNDVYVFRAGSLARLRPCRGSWVYGADWPVYADRSFFEELVNVCDESGRQRSVTVMCLKDCNQPSPVIDLVLASLRSWPQE